MVSRFRGFVVAAAVLVFGAVALRAHDIPNDVTLQVFVKPEGQTLRVLVRVPLNAMRDMDYPTPVRGSGLLDVARADSTLRDAATLWIADDLEVYEEGSGGQGPPDGTSGGQGPPDGTKKLAYPKVTAVMASLQSDRSFTSYEDAVAHLTGPRLPDNTQFLWAQGLLDVMFEYPIQSAQSHFSIHPKVDRLGLRTVTVLRFLPPGGSVRAFELLGDPGLVRLDPRWTQASFQFIKLGFEHILDGTDHLLFLFCLVIPFRRLRSLIAVVTSFTVAHSITLIASAYNLAPDALWFPPLIETLIATSIVYMALENIVSPQLKRRWLITFGFGLVHGFGFSFALRQTLQFAGTHMLTSLLSFNVGVELGQLLVLVVLIPALGVLFRYVVEERMGTIILSAIVAHTAWHWMTDRYAALRLYRFEWPAIDALFWVAVMRWAMIAVAAGGLYWLVFGVLKPRTSELKSPTPAPRPERPQQV
ncbi:MAG TPA: HupE/UreJ family protein [Vicinamibacterales bacterium]|nr:HupE/UreJ family protein [Vicinamibacterales bacterium]